MAYIEWKDSFSVYNNFLDGQHRKMIEAVNEIHEGFSNGHSAPDMGEKFLGLAALTRTHFQTEEIMMHATLYPGLEEHLAEHQKLLRDIDEIVGQLTRGERELTGELFEFLHKWVEEHLAAQDREFGDHLLAFIRENPDAKLPTTEGGLSS